MTSSTFIRLVADPARADRRALVGSVTLSVLRAAAELARPWPLALAVDHAIDQRALPISLPVVVTPTALLAAAGVATLLIGGTVAVLDLYATRLAERSAERIGARLRAEVFGHALRLPLRWHAGIRSAELVSRLTSDVGRLMDALAAITSTLVPESLTVAGVLVVLFVLDPRLAVLGLAVVPVLGLLSIRQRARVRASQQTARVAAGRLAGGATDLLRNVAAVQAFQRADWATGTFGADNDRVLAAELHAVDVETRWAPSADLVLAVGTALVLSTGGLQVLAGHQTTGHLLVVLSYLADLYAPVRALTRLAAVQAKAGASADRIGAVLATSVPVDRADAVHAPPLAGPIAVRDLTFGYDPGLPVLAGLDLDVAAGETVCLFGPSGVGKSTLLQLLLRLHDPLSGSISVGGVDLRNYRVDSLRAQIAYVPQDPWLLDATLAQNVAFGSRTASRARVLRACAEAGVDEFVHRLPLGHDTPLGEGAARLSGGQRRRVALARAAVSDASLVLLDEPTASLDAESARYVIAAVQAASRRRTTVIVTHDPALAAVADRVIRLTPDPTSADPADADLIPAGGR